MGCTSSKAVPVESEKAAKRSPPKKQSSSKERTPPDRLLSLNTGAVFGLGADGPKGVETRLRRLSAPVLPQTVEVEDSPVKGAEEQQQQPALVTSDSTRARRLSVAGPPEAVANGTDGSPTLAASDSSSALGAVYSTVHADGRSRSGKLEQLDKYDLMESLIHSVASLSRAGREPSYRKTNQDNCFAYQQYLHPSMALLGAMDGHGPNGHKVSAFVKQNLPVLLAKQLEHETDPGKALIHAFMATQEALCLSNIDCEFSGSTAVVSFLHGRHLTTAWVGDSRAVVARQEPRGMKGICLTKDHKPGNPLEKARIAAAGGRVERLTDVTGTSIGPARVWLQHAWVPGLAMSRALGDAVAHTVGVISEPDVEGCDIIPQDHFLVLASDGVWEFIDSQEACEIIAGCESAEQACRLLVDAAHERWVEEENGVVDDISVVVVKMKNG